jgi:nucleotide-binding universal stress UspA family protein
MSQAHLLIATDLLPKTEPAIGRTSLLAKTLRADVTLLHALPPESSDRIMGLRRQNARESLQRLVLGHRWPASPDTTVRVGMPAGAILEAATERDATMLVLGPHERGTMRSQVVSVLGGTIAARVLAARMCPVLIVREPPRHAYRRVMLAIDLSSNAADVVRAAEALVLDSHADASVLYAHDSPYMGVQDASLGRRAQYSALWHSHATVRVRSLLRGCSRDWGRYGIQIDDAAPARAILEAVNQQEPDLLVMGTSGRGPVGRALLGSVANQVLNEGWCDVLVVPQGSLDPRERVSEDGAYRRTPTRPNVSEISPPHSR